MSAWKTRPAIASAAPTSNVASASGSLTEKTFTRSSDSGSFQARRRSAGVGPNARENASAASAKTAANADATSTSRGRTPPAPRGPPGSAAMDQVPEQPRRRGHSRSRADEHSRLDEDHAARTHGGERRVPRPEPSA